MLFELALDPECTSFLFVRESVILNNIVGAQVVSSGHAILSFFRFESAIGTSFRASSRKTGRHVRRSSDKDS
jgi:hypothetical protein